MPQQKRQKVLSAPPRGITGDGDTAGLQRAVAEARERVAELEREVDALVEENHALLTSFADQELRVLDGYLVAVCPGLEVPFVATCPALRAGSQGATLDEALSELRDAMDVFIAYMKETGQPVPPQDVPA